MMAAGIRAQGSTATVIDQATWDGTLDADLAVFYGLEGNTPGIFEHYRTHAHAIYVDLGYWGRREGGRWSGYHKVVVDDRHPTAYYQRRQMPSDRLAVFHVEPATWRPAEHGSHILLAGMSDKGARAEGYEPEQWETETFKELRWYTDRPIVYRPKPSWKDARPLPEMGYSPRTETSSEAMRGCWAVVTRHSNIAMEAVLAGYPAFCTHGVGRDMASGNLARIEQPKYPAADARARWAANIAYCQWSIEEMRRGLPWAHLLNEGLI